MKILEEIAEAIAEAIAPQIEEFAIETAHTTVLRFLLDLRGKYLDRAMLHGNSDDLYVASEINNWIHHVEKGSK